jgi:hypothetical protein
MIVVLSLQGARLRILEARPEVGEERLTFCLSLAVDFGPRSIPALRDGASLMLNWV